MTETGEAASVQVRQLIAAPRDEVFAAFTQPEHVRQWWGPAGFDTNAVDVDLREGGTYRFEMSPASGVPTIVVAGTYERIDPPQRLVFTWKFVEGPPSGDPETYVVVDFHDRDGDTEVIVTHSRFPIGFDVSNYTLGWEDALGKLAARARGGRV